MASAMSSSVSRSVPSRSNRTARNINVSDPRRFLQTLHDRDHESGGEETGDDQDGPERPERDPHPQVTDDADEVDADGRGGEPDPLHEPLVLGRRHLGYERDADGAQEQIGDGPEEVG